jgi:hypothetical protein
VVTSDLLQSFAYTNTVSIPVNKNAHQAQLPPTPFFLTISVTKLGVSAEKVVATIDTPNSHQGIFLPERKNSFAELPAFLEVKIPIKRDMIKKAAMMAQSKVLTFMGDGFI